MMDLEAKFKTGETANPWHPMEGHETYMGHETQHLNISRISVELKVESEHPSARNSRIKCQ